MILYKYVSLEAGLKILESNSIAFTYPCKFNDPFELSAGFPTIGEDDPHTIYNEKFDWKIRAGVLSLTRNPLNPLMWAHYADSHKGIVIGIDCSDELLSSPKTCIIPAQYGSVIYTKTKPRHGLQFSKDKKLTPNTIENFSPEHLEQLQRIFLYKSHHWSYEEEVRIVKDLTGWITAENKKQYENNNGSFKVILDKNNQGVIHLLTLQPDQIKEIYINSIDSDPSLTVYKFNNRKELRKRHPSAKLYTVHMSNDSWELEQLPFGKWKDANIELVEQEEW